MQRKFARWILLDIVYKLIFSSCDRCTMSLSAIIVQRFEAQAFQQVVHSGDPDAVTRTAVAVCLKRVIPVQRFADVVVSRPNVISDSPETVIVGYRIVDLPAGVGTMIFQDFANINDFDTWLNRTFIPLMDPFFIPMGTLLIDD